MARSAFAMIMSAPAKQEGHAQLCSLSLQCKSQEKTSKMFEAKSGSPVCDYSIDNIGICPCESFYLLQCMTCRP